MFCANKAIAMEIELNKRELGGLHPSHMAILAGQCCKREIESAV